MGRTFLKLAALVTAAGLLPNCGIAHEKLWVSVRNEGSVSAQVWAETEDNLYENPMQTKDLILDPGEQIEYVFRYESVGRLTVRIWRTTDHFPLFDEDWNHNDLNKLDRRVSITVSP